MSTLNIVMLCIVMAFLALIVYVNCKPDPEWDKVVENAVKDGTFWSLLD